MGARRVCRHRVHLSWCHPPAPTPYLPPCNVEQLGQSRAPQITSPELSLHPWSDASRHNPIPSRPNLYENAIFSASTIPYTTPTPTPTRSNQKCNIFCLNGLAAEPTNKTHLLPGAWGGSHHPLPKKKKAPLGKCEPSIILTCAPQRLSSVPLHLCTAGFAFH